MKYQNKNQRYIKTALTALKRNLTRSILRTLGIMISVSAVISMVEIGQGSSDAIQSTISSMGANNLLILPGTAASGGVSFGAGSTNTLTPEDSDAIFREIKNIKNVAPIVRARGQVVYGNRNWVPMTISGTTPSFLDVRDWSNLTDGDMFTDQDVRNSSKVCTIGQTIARELFQGFSPIGKYIRIQNVSFKVIGVLSSKGANMMGQDQDDIILAPWTTIKTKISPQTSTSTASSSSTTNSSNSNSEKQNSTSVLYPSASLSLYPQNSSTENNNAPLSTRVINIDQIILSTYSSELTPNVIQEITRLLRDRHRIKNGIPEDFNIRDMSEMTKALTSTSSMMTTLLLCVAPISLVVGGVGIMNIML